MVRIRSLLSLLYPILLALLMSTLVYSHPPRNRPPAMMSAAAQRRNLPLPEFPDYYEENGRAKAKVKAFKICIPISTLSIAIFLVCNIVLIVISYILCVQCKIYRDIWFGQRTLAEGRIVRATDVKTGDASNSNTSPPESSKKGKGSPNKGSPNKWTIKKNGQTTYLPSSNA